MVMSGRYNEFFERLGVKIPTKIISSTNTFSRRELVLGRISDDRRSGLAHILGRLAGLVSFEQMLRKGYTHGRLHIGAEWIPANRAPLQVAVCNQPGTKFGVLCHAVSLRRLPQHLSAEKFKLHHYPPQLSWHRALRRVLTRVPYFCQGGIAPQCGKLGEARSGLVGGR